MLLSSASPIVLLKVGLPTGDGPPRAPDRMSAGAANGHPSDGDPARNDPESGAAEAVALVAAMSRGDRTALARLYDLFGRPLYALAHRVLNDSAEAQDIVHDVFLQLWQKAGDYEPGRGSVFAWAATLARNRAIDRVRMRRRRAEILQESAAEVHPPATDHPDSADTLWLREKAVAVRAALGRLAPDQRTAIELAFFTGLTQQEIAEKLNEPLGTIKARIRRGLLKLRETLPARL
jgi:RNA polymerase sigma-70 factor (ECF subfamily)